MIIIIIYSFYLELCQNSLTLHMPAHSVYRRNILREKKHTCLYLYYSINIRKSIHILIIVVYLIWKEKKTGNKAIQYKIYEKNLFLVLNHILQKNI